jgi:hypothetical protein
MPALKYSFGDRDTVTVVLASSDRISYCVTILHKQRFRRTCCLLLNKLLTVVAESEPCDKFQYVRGTVR